MPVVTEQDGPPVEQASKYELVIKFDAVPRQPRGGISERADWGVRYEGLMGAHRTQSHSETEMADSVSSQGSFTPAILKRFDQPDEVRLFEKGRFEIVHIGGISIGRATYEPGWRWSEHVGAKIGQRRCAVEHLGYVVSGAATAAFDDGRVFELRAGEMFYISPEPHDSWVLGNEPYVSLHLIGAGHYAKG